MKMKNKVLAVLALALLMINMVPVKRAEAATNVTCDLNGESVTHTVWDIREFDWSEWSVSEEALRKYLAPSELGDRILNDCNYMAVTYSKGVYTYFFGSQPFEIYNGSTYVNYSYVPYCSLIAYYSRNYIINVKNNNGVPVVTSVNGLENLDDFHSLDKSENIIFQSHNLRFLGSNYDIFEGYTDSYYDEVKAGIPYNNLIYSLSPVVLPVTESNYSYWLYHKTTSGEYMYWSKDPFDLEVSDGKYILNLSTGDIVYRLHLSSTHTYYRQILSGSMQYVISPGDVFRSGQDLEFDGITIDAWMEGDVTSEEVEKPQYDIPHITKFLSRIRSARSMAGYPREYSMSIDIALSGDFDEAVTEQKVMIDGNYILPSEEYFRFCDSENIDPSTTHFMKFVKNKQEEYYIFVDWSHIESIVNLAGLTSDYGFRLTYSNAIDALIERGEFDELYSQSVQAAYDGDIRKLCCPYRLACTLIGVVDGVNYYGDTFITVLYSEMDKEVEDVSGVYSDYVTLDNDQRTDAIESTINSAQDDKMQDYIDKKDAELDALIDEYEMKLATLDSTLSKVDTGSGDLFGTFSDIANGLSAMSGSFRQIAIAVGNVFAFFPVEITSLLYAGFAVCIVIAVYKAFRG